MNNRNQISTMDHRMDCHSHIGKLFVLIFVIVKLAIEIFPTGALEVKQCTEYAGVEVENKCFAKSTKKAKKWSFPTRLYALPDFHYFPVAKPRIGVNRKSIETLKCVHFITI